MENPFEIILERLDRIEKAIEKLENKTSSVHTNNPMNCKDLSEYLKISLSAIYKLIYKGSIPHYKNGRKLFFKREEINDWIFSTKVNTAYDIKNAADEYIRKHPKRY